MNVIAIYEETEDNLSHDRVITIRNILNRIDGLQSKDEPSHFNINFTYEKWLMDLYNQGQMIIEKNGEEYLTKYVPSFTARVELLNDDTNKYFDNMIIKRQHKKIRITSGAVISFRIEDEDKYIDAYITDWSPFPSACAIAVTPNHWVNVDKIQEGFTGKFVRHPMIGNLLPVYVAAWVRPDVGTGAVIINPAHSEVDLQYAKEIGLPIRFCLSDSDITANPQTWIKPPVVKKGRGVYIGDLYDGKDYLDLSDIYFDEMQRFGHMRKCSDVVVGTYFIGKFQPLKADIEDLKIEDMSMLLKNYRFKPSPMFEGLVAIQHYVDSQIITSYNSVEKGLLYFRLLYFDLLHTAYRPRDKILLVQKVQAKKGINEAVEKLSQFAVVINEDIKQVATLNVQHIDTLNKFIANNEIISTKYLSRTLNIKNNEESIIYDEISYLIKKLRMAEFKGIYMILTKIQKKLIDNELCDIADYKIYFLLFYIVFGEELTNSDILKDIMVMGAYLR